MWYRFAIAGPNYSPLEEKAINEYGITDDHGRAGYMLQDGTLIDFSEGYHERSLDHRNIFSIMSKNETHDNDYDNYVVPFAKETGALRISHYGDWNVDIISKPSNAQINYIVSTHRDGDPFAYDVPGLQDYIDNATKTQVFHLLKKIQANWDKEHNIS
jgi:hypothetical protein